jgi:colanic acid/amylovoran biosynthesis glycosyltransferase
MEASPVAISEAMSLGLPVIGSYHGGIPEIERDVDGLADAMYRMLRDGAATQAMGYNARQKVEHDLDRESWNDLLAERVRAMKYGVAGSD